MSINQADNSDIDARASLYVVATPIGNLGDITARARAVLAKVDKVAAEDTRNTGQLLDKLGIKKPLMATHNHNEKESAEGIVACLARGESVALVSDAGTPAVSDPGVYVVQAVAKAGFPVVPVPGASSVLAAVSASGLVYGPFEFRGFLPSKQKARDEAVLVLSKAALPVVVFEAPHRILELLEVMASKMADRQVCACRELTKQFETFYRGTALQVFEEVSRDPFATKGEWVIVVGEAEAQDEAFNIRDISEELAPLLDVAPTKGLAALVARLSGMGKKEAYQALLDMKKNQP